LIPLFLWRHRLLQKVVDRAHHLIAPSQFLAKRMVAWGAPADRIVHLANGLDTRGVQPRVRHRPNKPRFAFIGGLAPQKGVHILVEAFNELESMAQLQIYGDLDQFPDYADRLQAAARSPHISFHGRLDRAGIWQVLSEIDALLMPSIWYENAPVVIQEAFAAGTPVIASRLGAITEWVRHNENGLLVSPGDAQAWHMALSRLCEDPALVEKLSAHTPQPMTIDEHVDRILGRYRLALAGGGPVSDWSTMASSEPK
jgi:glycosyltransferase involved in cell wall biosynthesis